MEQPGSEKLQAVCAKKKKKKKKEEYSLDQPECIICKCLESKNELLAPISFSLFLRVEGPIVKASSGFLKVVSG